MKKIIPIALILFFGLGLFFMPYFIKVSVECKTQYGKCPDEITRNFLSGIRSLSVAEKGIGKALKDNPLVSDYSTHFKLPGIIEVNVLVKKPLFAIYDKDSGKVGVVGENGNILSVMDSSPLPQVITDVKFDIGTKVNDQQFFALKLMRGLYDMYQVQKGEIKDESLVVELPPKYTVIFPLEGDSQVLLGEVRLTYAKAQTSDSLTGYSQIDLRFKNPVLR